MPTSGSWNYQVTALQTKFLERVLKLETCWKWVGGVNSNGYGALRFEGKMQQAHRVAWKLYKEVPLSNLMVLHSCDNKLCVNPEHLFLGTHQDNMDDMKRKGRSSNGEPQAGESNGFSFLKNEDVAEIRRLRDATNLTLKQIAVKFNTSKQHIWRITHNKAWRHV